METTRPNAELQRPSIDQYADPVKYLSDMLKYRKAAEPGFSIFKATASLRRVSPTLVSLVLKGKRTLTTDRIEEFAKLMGLRAAEKHFFRAWIDKPSAVEITAALPVERKRRKDVSTHILKDWVNVYVKDMFQFDDVQTNPELAEKRLLHIATPKRVRNSIQFLLREGHLRRTLEGRIVLETELVATESKVPSQKIRQFHKAALSIAQKAIDRVPPSHRLANTLVIPLNEATYAELMELIEEFGAKLQDFAANKSEGGDTLYQFMINVSPVGAKI